MKRLNVRTFKKMIRRRSYTSVIVILAALALVWVTTESIGLIMLSLFLAGLFFLYQAFSGKKMRKQFISFAVLCFIGLGGLWLSFPDDRVLFKDEMSDLDASLERLVSQVQGAITSGGLAEEGELNPQGGELYQVESVTDGDTIKVRVGSSVETIRFIGIDTPEVYGGVECYGREASARMKQLVEGSSVYLEMDPSQGDKDRYSRLLRFVFTADGRNVGEVMLREGYAREYTYNKPYRYLDDFIKAESEAKEQQLGLWSDC